MPFNIEAIMASANSANKEQKQLSEERVFLLPISSLCDFPPELHHYRPADRNRLEELKESIEQNGILNPLLVRQIDNKKYEIIAGHNRRTAAQELGYTDVPCIVKIFASDDEAILTMNADNQHNRVLLPSERGWCFRQNLEIHRRQGQRTDLTSSQIETKLNDNEHTACESRAQEHRFIRLTYLIPALLDLVDHGKMGITVGYHLSFLSVRTQETVYRFAYRSRDKPIHIREVSAKALRAAEAEPDTVIDEDYLLELFNKPQKQRLRTVKIEMQELRQYFPSGTPEEVVVQTIRSALDAYFEYNHHSAQNIP